MNIEVMSTDEWPLFASTLESTKETEKHTIYYCPFCTKYGEPDSKPKFYYYHETESGYCFRCNTLLTLDEDASFQDVSAERLAKVLQKTTAKLYTSSEVRLVDDVSLEGLQDFDTDPEILSYVFENRSPLYYELMKKNNCKKITKNGYKGILFPFYFDGKVRYYQIRYLNNPLVRFYSSKTTKIPYFVNDDLESEELTLCEGIFSSYGLYYLGFKNPVAMLGKTITETNLTLLSEFKNLKVLNLAFDSQAINDLIYNTLSYRFPMLTYNFITFKGDPDEAFRNNSPVYTRQFNLTANLAQSLSYALAKRTAV